MPRREGSDGAPGPPEQPLRSASVATVQEWVEGARPRTLPTAIAPVLAGTGAAAGLELGFDALAAVLALVVSVSLVIGVNFANDYSDGIRGTDADRVGPMRLVGSGAATFDPTSRIGPTRSSSVPRMPSE